MVAREAPLHIGTVVVAAVLISAGLAGCLENDQGATNPKKSEAAPQWQAGDHWDYAVLSANGSERGTRTFMVLSETTFDPYGPDPAVPAYEVRLETRGPAENDTETQKRFYRQDTLSWMSGLCSQEHGASTLGCEGWVEQFDFPLHDGERWTLVCCGDVLTERTVEATVGPEPVGSHENTPDSSWALTVWRNESAGQPHEVIHYDRDVGFMVERLLYGETEVHERWVLTAWSYANGTSGSHAPS